MTKSSNNYFAWVAGGKCQQWCRMSGNRNLILGFFLCFLLSSCATKFILKKQDSIISLIGQDKSYVLRSLNLKKIDTDTFSLYKKMECYRIFFKRDTLYNYLFFVKYDSLNYKNAELKYFKIQGRDEKKINITNKINYSGDTTQRNIIKGVTGYVIDNKRVECDINLWTEYYPKKSYYTIANFYFTDTPSCASK